MNIFGFIYFPKCSLAELATKLSGPFESYGHERVNEGD